ncbi:MAG: tRNA-dihydrouridine synthase B [Phycisphaerales bacterium]|jgi:tRNA-dihydrouridine synthase B
MDPRVRALVPGFDAPFFQAGLAGYSDAAMRIVARRQGCPMCVTEALLDRSLLGGGKGFLKADLGDVAHNVPGGDEDHPLSGQIMGSDPAEMAAAAVKMVEQARREAKAYRDIAYTEPTAFAAEKKRSKGTQEQPEHSQEVRTTQDAQAHLDSVDRTFATIDVNLACPVKKISKKSRGGHWLREPDGAIAILKAVREALPKEVAVTVKMRRAFDETPEMRESFLKIFDAAYGLGCAWVTVHGRTVTQKYLGPSQWDPIQELVVRNPERIVFGSGDVWTWADIFRMIGYTGVCGASVARGCIGNPWIFRQARDVLAGKEPRTPTVAEQREVLMEHFELAVAVNERWVRGKDSETKRKRAENFTGKTMRKFGIKFADHHPEGQAVKRAFIKVETLDDWRGVLGEWYGGAEIAGATS